MAKLWERLWSTFDGPESKEPEVKDQNEPENAGKGVMYDFKAMGGDYYNYINAQYTLAQKAERLSEYREMEFYPEIAFAIDLTINSCTNYDIEDKMVTINIADDELKEAKGGKIADLIMEEWKKFYEHVYGGDMALESNFRRWFVDGQLWLEPVRKKGGAYTVIKRLPAETMFMELDKKGAAKKYYQMINLNNKVNYGIVNGLTNPTNMNGENIIEFKTSEIMYLDSSIYGPIGFHDPRSRLESALRTFRQLKLIEDALVIYRLTRAPEKRVFNVDIGTMPKGDAEQYIQKLIQMHRSKNFYDPVRGEISKKYNPISLNEDIWIPTRGGTPTTKVDTLQGAANLGNITDVEYFLKKIYRAMNVPDYLVDDKNSNTGDRVESVRTQDVAFARYCERLQQQFATHLAQLFIYHLRYMKIDSIFDELTTNDIKIKLTPPSYYKEYRLMEIEKSRIELFQQMVATNAFPREWLLRNVMKKSDEEIKDLMKSIEKEEEFKPLVEVTTGMASQADQAEEQMNQQFLMQQAAEPEPQPAAKNKPVKKK